MDRTKFVGPTEETKKMERKNPANHFHARGSHPKGKSGKGVVREVKKKHAKRA